MARVCRPGRMRPRHNTATGAFRLQALQTTSPCPVTESHSCPVKGDPVIPPQNHLELDPDLTRFSYARHAGQVPCNKQAFITPNSYFITVLFDLSQNSF